jgi:hypothetical protein
MNNIPTYYPALVNYCGYGAPPELKGLRGSDASTYRNKDGSTTFGLEKIAPPSITADEKLYPTTDLAELVELTAKTWSGSLRFIHGADQWAWKDDKGRWFICPSSRRHVPAGEVYSMLCFVYLVMRATITPAVIEACVAWHRDNPGKRPAARTVIRAAWKPWRETYTAMVSKMNKRSIGPMMRALADHPALASTESEWVLPPREERRPWWTAREVTYLARRECAPSKTNEGTDTVQAFIDQCCVRGDERTAAGPLLGAYNDWAKKTHAPTHTANSFSDQLNRLGFEKKRTNTGQFILGLRLNELALQAACANPATF